MEISEQQVHFNRLMDHQHAPKTIQNKMAISRQEFREMLKIYVEYEEYKKKMEIITVASNEQALKDMWMRINDLIELLKSPLDEAQQNTLQQEYDELIVKYSEFDINENKKIL